MGEELIEAMRFGIPVATTASALRGMNSTVDFVPACDSVDDRVAAIAHLNDSDDEWRLLSRREQDFARRNFSLEALRETLRVDLALMRPDPASATPH
jgi:hypothetical protein